MVPKADGLGLGWIPQSFQRGLWIGNEQAVCSLFAGLAGHVIKGLLQMRRTPFGVVRVRGDEMDPITLQKLVGKGFSQIAEAAI